MPMTNPSHYVSIYRPLRAACFSHACLLTSVDLSSPSALLLAFSSLPSFSTSWASWLCSDRTFCILGAVNLGQALQGSVPGRSHTSSLSHISQTSPFSSHPSMYSVSAFPLIFLLTGYCMCTCFCMGRDLAEEKHSTDITCTDSTPSHMAEQTRWTERTRRRLQQHISACACQNMRTQNETVHPLAILILPPMPGLGDQARARAAFSENKNNSAPT